MASSAAFGISINNYLQKEKDARKFERSKISMKHGTSHVSLGVDQDLLPSSTYTAGAEPRGSVVMTAISVGQCHYVFLCDRQYKTSTNVITLCSARLPVLHPYPIGFN